MVDPARALASIPADLRGPLLAEYKSVVQNYMERRWSPAEISGGKFCEVVYTILDGYGKGVYASGPSKPRDFLTACRNLEGNAHVPRSFQILIQPGIPGVRD